MATARPVATAWRAPGGSVTSSAASTSIPAAPSVAYSGSSSPSKCGSRLTRTGMLFCECKGNPFDDGPPYIFLGHFRKVLDARGRDNMHGIRRTAHDIARDV